MKFQIEGVILGARKFNDSVEGTDYDFTKVRVMMPVPDGAENEIGFNVTEMQFGDHKNFDKFEKHTFPLKAKLDLVATSKGYDFVGFEAVAAQPLKAANA